MSNRRLPVYLGRDTPGSLRQNPFALEPVSLAIVPFGRAVRDVLSLALRDICDNVTRDVRKSTPDERADWRPMRFVMTDEKPSDTQAFEEAIPHVSSGYASFFQWVSAAGMALPPPADSKLVL